MRSVQRIASVAVAAVVPMIFLAGAASAAGVLPITVQPNPIVQGAEASFSGSGCAPSLAPPGAGTEVDIEVVSDVTGVENDLVVFPDTTGSWTGTIKVLANAPLGSATVSATCDFYTGSFDYADNTFKVVAPSSIIATVSLPGYPGVAEPIIKAGATVAIDGTNFLPNEKVAVELHSTPIVLASFLANSDGNVTGTVTIPADTVLGVHDLDLLGQTSGRLAVQAVDIVSSQATIAPAPTSVTTSTAVTTTTTTTTTTSTSTSTLASTGIDAMGMGTLAFGLALAGGGALLLGRRRTGRAQH